MKNLNYKKLVKYDSELYHYYLGSELIKDDVYLAYDPFGVTSVKLNQYGSFFYTNEPSPVKATTIPLIKFNNIVNSEVIHTPTNTKGKLKLVLPTGDYLRRYCFCYWYQGQKQAPYGWVELNHIQVKL